MTTTKIPSESSSLFNKGGIICSYWINYMFIISFQILIINTLEEKKPKQL